MFSLPNVSSRRLISSVLTLAAVALFAATEARAQDTVTGAFEGTVTDSQTGAPVAGASVQFINQLSEVPVAKRTDSQGRFYQGLLPPGVYTIRVTASGFKVREVEQRLLATRPNAVVPVPVVLEPESGIPTTTTTTTTATTTPTPVPTGTPQAGGTKTASPATEDRSVLADINTTDARRGGAFTEEEVSRLPLGATTLIRTFDELALLLPGVAESPQTEGGGAGPGVGSGVGSAGQFAVNGLRSRANNFMIDGSDNNDEDIGVRRQGFLSLVPQPIESIKEFQVITLLAPAQFGRNIGAQVNAISKSGGNQFHGTFFGFLNASQLNARNPLDTANGTATFPLVAGGRTVLDCTGVTFPCTAANGRPITVTNQSGGEDSSTLTQAGLVLGGPLMPDKLFFFISAEGQFLNARKEASFAVPTVAQRGLFGTGATGISVNPFDPTMMVNAFPTSVDADAIFSLFPFPNNPNGIYGGNTFTENLPASGQGKVFSGKVDYNFKLRERQNQFTARYNFTDDWRDLPVTGGALFSSLRPRVRTQNLSTFLNSELSGANSTHPMFNQLRLSYGRTRLAFDENRDTQFLIPSDRFPGEPFLLNARRRVNFTLPSSPAPLYVTGGTVEGDLGPVGQVVIAGFSPVGVDVFNFPQRRVNNTYQVADTLTYRTGNHSFAFGTDIRRTELNSDLPRNSRPLITFGGAPLLNGSFISGIDLAAASAATGFFQTLATTGSDIGLRYYQLNFFGQDEWRVRPNLSISYGLRYEYNTPPREVNKRIESAFDAPALALLPGLRALQNRNQIFEPDRNNFAPRVGFAWSPNIYGRDHESVIRAGYGLYYDQILGAVVSQSRNVFPNFLTVNFAGGFGATGGQFDLFNPSNALINIGTPMTPNFVPLVIGLNGFNPQVPLSTFVNVVNSIFPGGFGATLPNRTLKTPMAHQFNVTYEQQLSRNFVASVSYVGTRGRNLLRTTTPNFGANAFLLPLAFSVAGNVPAFGGFAFAPGSTTSFNGRPVPSAGAVNIYSTSASSRYNALQVELRGRYKLLTSSQFQVNYTYSRATDDASDVFDLAGSPALPQNSLTFAGERAPSNFDVRHRVSYSQVSTLPEMRNRNSLVRFLFGGMQFASAGFFHTGQPFTVNSIYDINLDGNLTDRLNTLNGIVLTGDRSHPITTTSRDPVFLRNLLAPTGADGAIGRNTFRSGKVMMGSLAVIKNFNVAEGKNLTFRMEIFNVFNRSNFGVPIRTLESPGFGRAIETVTPSRRIQFALKYTF
ncbi:MAG TPA: carboxypeptidase regulatory-like domain-containing protein [Pyrinomonadaceae bacterium]